VSCVYKLDGSNAILLFGFIAEDLYCIFFIDMLLYDQDIIWEKKQMYEKSIVGIFLKVIATLLFILGLLEGLNLIFSSLIINAIVFLSVSVIITVSLFGFAELLDNVSAIRQNLERSNPKTIEDEEKEETISQ